MGLLWTRPSVLISVFYWGAQNRMPACAGKPQEAGHQLHATDCDPKSWQYTRPPFIPSVSYKSRSHQNLAEAQVCDIPCSHLSSPHRRQITRLVRHNLSLVASHWRAQVFLEHHRVTASHQHPEVAAKRSLPFPAENSSSSVLHMLGFVSACFGNTAFLLVPS